MGEEKSQQETISTPRDEQSIRCGAVRFALLTCMSAKQRLQLKADERNEDKKTRWVQAAEQVRQLIAAFQERGIVDNGPILIPSLLPERQQPTQCSNPAGLQPGSPQLVEPLTSPSLQQSGYGTPPASPPPFSRVCRAANPTRRTRPIHAVLPPRTFPTLHSRAH